MAEGLRRGKSSICLGFDDRRKGRQQATVSLISSCGPCIGLGEASQEYLNDSICSAGLPRVGSCCPRFKDRGTLRFERNPDLFAT